MPWTLHRSGPSESGRPPSSGPAFTYDLPTHQVPSDEYDEGVVVEEVQPGYMIQGKLVRAACVLISAG